MGVSEGVYQAERDFKNGSDINFQAGAHIHPYSLKTVLWERSDALPVDVFVEVVDRDRIYTVDQVLATVLKSYVFPNARTSPKIDLTPDMRIRFRTAGEVGNHSVAIVWSELGVS